MDVLAGATSFQVLTSATVDVDRRAEYVRIGTEVAALVVTRL